MATVNNNVSDFTMRNLTERYGQDSLMAYKMRGHSNTLNMGLVILTCSVAMGILFSIAYLMSGHPAATHGITRIWTTSGAIALGGVAVLGYGYFLLQRDENKRLKTSEVKTLIEKNAEHMGNVKNYLQVQKTKYDSIATEIGKRINRIGSEEEVRKQILQVFEPKESEKT